MRRIDTNKKEIQKFVISIKSKYCNIGTSISFDDFLLFFCSDSTEKLELEMNKLENGKADLLKLYDSGIGTTNSNHFFTHIREYIIDTFTKDNYFCPYCGKSPLIHFDEDNKRKRMFQFDHFFPKSEKKHPELAINFYNLIPSCNACNHLKGDDDPSYIINHGGTVFHPHFGNLYMVDGEVECDYSDNADIRLNYLSKNSKFWRLGIKYLNSQDTFNEFAFMHDKYTKIKAEKLGRRGKGSGKSEDDFKNQYFSGYYSDKEADILKHSNGKFKKDLIGNMKF